jgi:TIGR02679 family protein
MMSTMDLDRLRRVLGRDETRWVIDRVRKRLAAGESLSGRVTLPAATAAQRRAIDTLLGRPPGRGQSLTVPLDKLDAVIRRSGLHAEGLEGAVVALTGPVVRRAEAQAELQQAWASVLAPLAEVADRRPALRPWFDRAVARGLIKRLCGAPTGAAPVVASAARLLDRLPVAGIPLSQLATDVAGRAHALDPGRPLSTIVLSAIRRTWWTGATEPTSPAQRRRALWDCVGVLTDELSSTVLVLNLPVSHPADSGLARILAVAGDSGEPLVLNLRQLTRTRLAFGLRPIFVCENPSVVLAAANALGPACPPLVCVGGQPTAAAMRLLAQLSQSGCTLHYHGDFDWGGIRIANLLWGRFPMQAWRFDTRSYVDGLSGRSVPLRGRPVTAVWDPDLRTAIERHGVRLEEEAVLTDLLTDLNRGAPPESSSQHG